MFRFLERKKEQALMTEEQKAAMPNPLYNEFLTQDYALIALKEGLIKPEEAAAMPNAMYLYYIAKYENILTALRDKLITPKQIAAMPTSSHLHYFTSDTYYGSRNPNNIITALKKGWLTSEKIAALTDYEYLYHLTSNDAIRAYELNLITPEIAVIKADKSPSSLYVLFRNLVNSHDEMEKADAGLGSSVGNFTRT